MWNGNLVCSEYEIAIVDKSNFDDVFFCFKIITRIRTEYEKKNCIIEKTNQKYIDHS